MCEKMDKLIQKVKVIERENGIKIGEEQGEKRGQEKERIANAKAMLENGVSIDIIIKCIPLSLEKIQQLQKEITIN